MATKKSSPKKKTSAAKIAATPKPRRRVSAPVTPAVTDGDGNGSHGSGKALVVVESPAKAKTIAKYLGFGFAVNPTVGHIRDLPTKTLGINLDDGFDQIGRAHV